MADKITRRYLIDLAERVGATAAEAGLAYAITAVAGLDPIVSFPLTVALSAVKGALARFVGRADTAALVPAPYPVDTAA